MSSVGDVTTETLTLADFLLARIAEDEELARQVGESDQWRESRGEVFAVSGINWRRLAEIDEANGVSTIAGEHMARHDPARVLAECEAKRRIVALDEIWNRPERTGPNRGAGYVRQDAYAKGHRDASNSALIQLALPYADHPDYRQEWKP